MMLKALYKKRASRGFGKFFADDRGSNTVEFAVVAPFLLGLWLLGVAAIDMENSTTMVGKITSSVSDIIAQSPIVNADVVDASMNAGEAMLGNTRANRFEMYVAGIEVVDNNGNMEAVVLWSRGKNLKTLTAPTPGTIYPLDNNLKSRTGFIVTAHGRLEHTPVYGQKLNGGPSRYDYQNYFVPRVSLQTECEDC